MRIKPTLEQQRILDLGPTTMRIRAGAGTGKTTTVALVIANLVAEHGIDPERILGMTFTNKAAAELAERVAQNMPDAIDRSRQVEVHTYHGFAAQVLSEFGAIGGVDMRAGVITPTFARQLIRDVFLNTSYRHLDMTNTRVLDDIRRLGDQLGDHLLRPDEVMRAAATHDENSTWNKRVEMASTLAAYDEAKRALRVADYGDLVTLSVRILQDQPDLVDTIRDRYRIVVLDEYQDTNPAQRVLLTTIFGNGFPVIAVGDEDQTIYEWRGASAENFEEFINHFTQPDGSPAHDLGLTLNRRSGPGIIRVANEVRRRANPSADELAPANDHETEIITHWASDALAEAEWIARQFESIHDSGVAWSDMAVLLRKNKDFAVMVDALSRHDIPLEVANVGGLLSVPEVALLRSWLTVLENPEDSTALAEILFGSSYRLGLADLAVLTRWLTANQPERDDEEEPHPVTLIEAIESASEIDGLSPAARYKLDRFHSTYRTLLVETQGMSLVETCRMTLDTIRAWQDVESLPPNQRLTARLNLYRFLDLAGDWSPLTGRPSLGAFLDYLAAMEEEPAEELDSARLSGEDAVTLVTVHRAKGLEWDNVAIPTTAKGNFPSGSGKFPDPHRFPEQVPPELRLDSTVDDLPDDPNSARAFFRQRHDAQEWRVAYVAVTRARKRLFVSGAYWYGLPEPRTTPAEPSELFEMIESHPDSMSAGHADPGPRPEILRTDPYSADPDPVFPDGWQSGLHMAVDDPDALANLAKSLGVSDEADELARDLQQRLFSITEIPAIDEGPETPTTVSVTGLVTYAQCPKRFYWSDVDPLPRRVNPAATRGTEVHRRIELHQRGEIPFEDLSDDLYDVSSGEGTPGPGAFDAYLDSRFAEMEPVLVEAPFTLDLDGYRIRGRIDAVYADGEGWEIVDFKSGFRSDDPSRVVQLQAYAVAGEDIDFGVPHPDHMKVTFAYLGGGKVEEVTAEADEEWVRQARSRLDEIVGSIEGGQFDPSPGSWCSHCDFVRFCPVGRSWLEQDV